MLVSPPAKFILYAAPSLLSNLLSHKGLAMADTDGYWTVTVSNILTWLVAFLITPLS